LWSEIAVAREEDRHMTQPAPRTGELSRSLTLLLAAATGLVAANLYYAQPLLHRIAVEFGVREAAASLVVTVAQLGYAVGLLLLVPVGDLVDRRRLVPGVLAATTLALLSAAVAPTLPLLVLAVGGVGVASVVVQILVPLAAELAADDQRGRVVGTVVSGLLLGILLSRTVSGVVGGWIGWRAMYVIAAGACGALGVVLARALPADGPRPRLRYGQLLRSVGALARQQPRLLRHAVYGALGFAAFSAFWTNAAFLLSGPHYRYDEATIGLFGLVGAAGALTASVCGRLADRGQGRVGTLALGAGLVASFGLLALAPRSLAALIAGIVALDVAVQGIHVLNQSEIYRLAPNARSRANSIYMTAYFVGGASGSAASASLYQGFGWTGVAALGAIAGAAIVAVCLGQRGPDVAPISLDAPGAGGEGVIVAA
jgi:predicted MFS family arabinose efflux permease